MNGSFLNRSGARYSGAGTATEPESEQPSQVILETNLLVGVVANGEFLARGRDRASGIERSRGDSQVDVGHERSKEDHTIAALDILTHIIPAHRAFINPQIERVLLSDHRFAQHR